ncbi:hypothetical protein [Pseudomonas sp. Au-Pse12]|uniref:hypothetical protein n=1 Tax=Pseudomonas sp. Au-Pse12 TaxID=2906459 RepID=UPI001E2C7BE5|nr:hypothetical protein [Pseudomonas sp. Au-Pse12]MCE4055189.1 hypothetical protein [Pseudomonas sp. Au-Pse12]
MHNNKEKSLSDISTNRVEQFLDHERGSGPCDLASAPLDIIKATDSSTANSGVSSLLASRALLPG